MPKPALVSLTCLILAVLLVAGVGASEVATTTEVVSIGTLAPRKSPWGKQLAAWARGVKKKSEGLLELKVYYNGQQGDVREMIAKVGTGQLDGVLSDARGLVDVYQPIAALEMPGLFKRPAVLTAAIDELRPELEAGASANGFELLDIGAAGRVRTLSKGKPIRVPADLADMKVYCWKDDVIAPVAASVLGYSGVPSSVPGLLPNLSSGRINVIDATPLESTQHQWWSHLDHVHDNVVALRLNGLVLSKGRIEALPSGLRDLLRNTGARNGRAMRRRVLKEDLRAYDLLKNRMIVVERTRVERNQWKAEYAEVRAQLAKGTFAAAWVERLEELAGL